MAGWRGSLWFQPMFVASLVFLAGCSHYWYKADDAPTSLQQFSQDHRACLEQAGTPVVNRPGYAVIDEQAFRRCLIARGWTRRKVPVLDVMGQFPEDGGGDGAHVIGFCAAARRPPRRSRCTTD